jgi:hypothetical protein
MGVFWTQEASMAQRRLLTEAITGCTRWRANAPPPIEGIDTAKGFLNALDLSMASGLVVPCGHCDV